MNAEVYRWFTETSGIGLAEQMAQLMDPKVAAKQEAIAGASDLWQERSNRLAPHGADYPLGNACKHTFLTNIMVGNAREPYELWETARLPFEELLRKSKGFARAKKLDTDAARGRSGVALCTAQETPGARGGQSGEAAENAEDVGATRTRKLQQNKPACKGEGQGQGYDGGKWV